MDDPLFSATVACMTNDSSTWEFSKEPKNTSVCVMTLTIVGHAELSRIGEVAVLPPNRSWQISRRMPSFRPLDGTDQGTPLNDRFVSRELLNLKPTAEGLNVERGNYRGPVVVEQKPLNSKYLLCNEELQRGVVIELGPRTVLWLQKREIFSDADSNETGILGESVPMHCLKTEVSLAAQRDEPALILGESGSGKELVARALHTLGPRSQGPFVPVNLATLPSTLAVTEFFGHRKGAFTGAQEDRKGLFERARGGTLFLDEIGEASIEVQAMLLRAIQEKAFVPLGQSKGRRADLRILAATDVNLERSISQGHFRLALFHRLAAIKIEVPPLRERCADIARIFASELQKELGSTEAPPWLLSSIISTLMAYDWPGNIRELQNVTRRLVMIGDNDDKVEQMMQSLRPEKAQTTTGRPLSQKGSEALTDQGVAAALEKHNYCVHAAAKSLGVNRATFYRRIRDHPHLRLARDIGITELRRQLKDSDGQIELVAEALKVSQSGLKFRLRELGLL